MEPNSITTVATFVRPEVRIIKSLIYFLLMPLPLPLLMPLPLPLLVPLPLPLPLMAPLPLMEPLPLLRARLLPWTRFAPPRTVPPLTTTVARKRVTRKDFKAVILGLKERSDYLNFACWVCFGKFAVSRDVLLMNE
jgi:hypothetical protein